MKMCNDIAEQASRNRLDEMLGYKAGNGSIKWTSLNDIYCHYDGVYGNYLIELKQLTYKGKGLMVDKYKVDSLIEAVKKENRKDALIIWTIEGLKDIYMVSVPKLLRLYEEGKATLNEDTVWCKTKYVTKQLYWLDFDKAWYRKGE